VAHTAAFMLGTVNITYVHYLCVHALGISFIEEIAKAYLCLACET